MNTDLSRLYRTYNLGYIVMKSADCVEPPEYLIVWYLGFGFGKSCCLEVTKLLPPWSGPIVSVGITAAAFSSLFPALPSFNLFSTQQP